jgi:hypothetical protein
MTKLSAIVAAIPLVFALSACAVDSLPAEPSPEPGVAAGEEPLANAALDVEPETLPQSIEAKSSSSSGGHCVVDANGLENGRCSVWGRTEACYGVSSACHTGGVVGDWVNVDSTPCQISGPKTCYSYF